MAIENITFLSLGKRMGVSRGVPNVLMHHDKRTKHIPASLLPSPEEAAHIYRDNVGRLTDPASFGDDPLGKITMTRSVSEIPISRRNTHAFIKYFTSLLTEKIHISGMLFCYTVT